MLCFILLTMCPTYQGFTKEKIKKWYATANEFLILPCFTDDEMKSDQVSLIRWYESYGNPVWAGLYLTIQVYEKEDKRNFFCDIFNWKGETILRVWHKVSVYVQPLIFFDFLSSIPTEDFFSIEQQAMTSRGDKFLKKLKKQIAKICRLATRCRFATILLNQSLKEKIALSIIDAAPDMLALAEKHDNETTQLSVTYQIDINDLHFMSLKPESVYNELKQIMRNDFDRHTQEELLNYGRIKITPSIETICPVGYIRDSHSIRCVRCEPGTVSAVGSSSCTECARGFYQPEPAKAECIPCPAMYVTEGTGAINLDECIVDGNFLIIASANFMQYFWNILAHYDFENYNLVLLGTFVYFLGSTLIVMRLLYRIYIFSTLKSHYERIEQRLMKVATLGQITIAERQHIQIQYQKILDKERAAMQETSYL